MRACAAVVTLAMLMGVSAQDDAACFGDKYTAVSAACCPASSSRRLQGDLGDTDINDCPHDGVCTKACAALLPAFLKTCGVTTGVSDNVGVVNMAKTCKAVNAGTAGFTTRPKYRCGYDTSKSFTTKATAEAACLESDTCSGVYFSSCTGTTSKYSRYYMCKPGYMPKPSASTLKSKYSRYCVYQKASVALVAAPANGCLASPCKNGGTCTSSVSQDYTRGSPTYKQYISRVRCTCPRWSAGDDTIVGSLNCAKKVASPCTDDYCKNGGTCRASFSSYSATSKPSAYCSCKSGWIGRQCDKKNTPKCVFKINQNCRMMCPPIDCPAGSCYQKEDSCCKGHCETTSDKATKTCSAAETAAGKSWISCGSACPKTCGGTDSAMCMSMCVMGCFCGKGLYYDPKTLKCVDEDDCTTAPVKGYGGMRGGGMRGGVLMDGGFGRGGIAIGRPFTTAGCAQLTASAIAGDAADDSWSR